MSLLDDLKEKQEDKQEFIDSELKRMKLTDEDLAKNKALQKKLNNKFERGYKK